MIVHHAGQMIVEKGTVFAFEKKVFISFQSSFHNHARENRGFVSLQSSGGGGKIFPPPLKIFQLQYAGVEYDSNNLLEGAQEYL